MDDPFGEALKDYFFKNKSPKIEVVRDDGFEGEQIKIAKYFTHLPDWPEYEIKVLRFVQGKVLDIGAGAGRHSVYLQKKDHKIKPIDISPGAVKVMNARGLENAEVVDIRQNLAFEENFDTVLLLGNNFGLAGTVEGTKTMLDKLGRSTTADGRIVATTRDPLKTDLGVHREYHQRNEMAGNPPGLLKLRTIYKKNDKTLRGDWFKLLFFTKKELKKLIEDTIWNLIETTDIKDGKYGFVLEKQVDCWKY